jgi:hypothetical protein
MVSRPSSYAFTTDSFFYGVLTHFRQVHRFSYANVADFIGCRRVRNDLLSSPVLGSLELQHAEIVAFLPFAICFFTHLAKLSGNYVGTP